MTKLSTRMILTFSLIILTGTIVMVSVINYTTRTGYQTFVKTNTKQLNNGIEKLLLEYYNNNESWQDIENFVKIPKPKMTQQQPQQGQPRIRMSMFARFTLTDENGKIILNTQNIDSVDTEHLEHAKALTSKGKTVGYLLTGYMEENSLTREEENFLGEIKKIIIIVSGLTLFASIFFIYLFSRRITKPVTELSNAALDLEKGNYSRRVIQTGSDELSRLSGAFNRMAESIESNDQWRKRIIADSAHELRTPVTLIQGNLELILEGVYKADQENIKNIYDETVVLSKLIKELQQLSSAESGSMEMTLQRTNILGLLEKSKEMFNTEAQKKGINLSLISEDKELEIDADYSKIQQVITNILANAVRHTPENGSISITSAKVDSSVVISVDDTGSGIPESDLEKIFERFYRTDSSRNRDLGGSGLGLSISREIVRLHNGTIHAENHNNGARFILKLPL